MTVRKEGKARWVYECQPCGDRVEAYDQFRATEYGQWHERTAQHVFGAVGVQLQVVMDEISKYVLPAVEAFQTAVEFGRIFEPPKNLPHDPSLLRDRRKWGGR